MPRPEITVLVPTRDRPALLARCLAALEHQTIAAAIEVVVVDDGSRRAAETATAAARLPGTRLVRQEPSGVSAARNAGAREARAPVVLLTDDDCRPRPDWAERLLAACRAGADAAAGPTVNARRENGLAEATQTVVNYLAERSRDPEGGPPFAPGSNLACTAETLRAIPFDEGYPAGGEDRDWCARVAGSSRRLVWEQGAVVVHEPQLTLGGFVAKHVAYGRGAHRFRSAHPSTRALGTPGFYGGLVARGFAGGARLGLLVCLAQAATALGYAGAALGRGRE